MNNNNGISSNEKQRTINNIISDAATSISQCWAITCCSAAGESTRICASGRIGVGDGLRWWRLNRSYVNGARHGSWRAINGVTCGVLNVDNNDASAERQRKRKTYLVLTVARYAAVGRGGNVSREEEHQAERVTAAAHAARTAPPLMRTSHASASLCRSPPPLLCLAAHHSPLMASCVAYQQTAR